MEQKRYVGLNEFLAIARIKERTFKKRMKEIKGVRVKSGKILIEEGTRYPMPKIYRARNLEQRFYLILKATSLNRYVDHLFLGLYRKQFYDMIDDLVKAELLKPNGMSNHYGANQYDCTLKAEDIRKKKKRESVEWLANLLIECAGKFSGELLSRIISK